MARPLKANIDYFSHDNNMRNDPKLKAVRTRFGIKGYAIYNMLLETLAESNLLCVKLTEIGMEIMSGDFGIESEELIKLIDYFEKINLIKKQNGFIFCPQLDKRVEGVFEKRTQYLDSLRKKNGIIFTETIVSGAENTQSKVKESKVKESKVKESKNKYGEYNHVLLTQNEYEKLIKDFGEKNILKAIEILDEAIEMKGYKYKNHNLVLRKWPIKQAMIGRGSKFWNDVKKNREALND